MLLKTRMVVQRSTVAVDLIDQRLKGRLPPDRWGCEAASPCCRNSRTPRGAADGALGSMM